MSEPTDNRGLVTLFRVSMAVVVVFALGLTAWLVDKAVLNPDVRAKRPSWFEGAFDMPFWLPLILTILGGSAAVLYVYVRASRRLRDGEDIRAGSFRDRQRRGETGREQL